MSILVHLPPFMAGPVVQALREKSPSTTIWSSLSAAQPDLVEAIVAWSIPPGRLADYPNLRLISAATAGVDKLMPDDLPAHVQISRVVDPAQQTGIAHYVLAAALRHSRGLAKYADQQRRGEWTRHRSPGTVGGRVGVLGLGGVGGTVARMFSSIGFTVSGWSRTKKQLDGVDTHVGEEGLSYVLQQSDILVCTLPLTPDTRGLLNYWTLAKLPAGAYLINVGRGEHVVEPDLIELIDANHLAGATLDVFCHEPPTSDDPIWTHPRIDATPHVATDPSLDLAAEQCIENLTRAREGRPLLNVVLRDRGY